MPEQTQHWTESLFASVYALYETAHEYQTAHRAAQVAVQTVTIDRRHVHEGRVRPTRDDGRREGSRAPHEWALFNIHDLYSHTERELRRRYEEAALLYASGAAWAIAAVQGDETPALVEFDVTEDNTLVPHQLSITGLARWTGAEALAAAYDQVRTRMGAAEYAEDLAGRDYVSDYEAGEMHGAMDVAMGLADAAFAYGLLAQRAVNFVLLDPRRAYEREIALARAAAIDAAEQPQPTA